MKKSFILLFMVAVLFMSGCDYLKNLKYKGKVFRIRAEIQEEDKVKVLLWENAKKVFYDSEENIYSFHVNNKLVTLDSRGAVIIEEQ